MRCFFFQAEDGIRDHCVTGVQTCALPISDRRPGALPNHEPSGRTCAREQRRLHRSGGSLPDLLPLRIAALMSLDELIRRIPKAELHIHVEGSLEPELMFEIARRNGVALRHGSVDALRQAYQFTDLQSFLDIYYQGAAVLLRERDFYEITMAYLRRAAADNVRHAEIFFDPQTHTRRGIAFATVIEGISAALQIGRASCRERVLITVEVVPYKYTYIVSNQINLTHILTNIVCTY